MKRCQSMTPHTLGSLLAAFGAALALPAFGAAPAAPTISGYAATNPRGVPITSAPPTAPMLIEGQNLGTSGMVAFNGIPAPAPASWSPTEILVTVPAAPSYPFVGPVTVTTSGQTAKGPAFTITPPPPPPTLAQSPTSVPLPMPAPPPTLRPGSLDPGFGTGGLVLTDFGGYDDVANAVALQPDGRILVAGESDAPSKSYLALARYNANGSLDASFGAGGGLADIGGRAGANALALQPDGRIVVAGILTANSNSYFALARYKSDGSPDTGFGAAGKVLTDFGGSWDAASALAVQPNGQIVAIGSSNANGKNNFALARYNADGSLDGSFGSGGKVLTDLNSAANAVALQPDGKIVVAGDIGLARYNANGALDPAFGAGGEVPTDVGGSAVAVQPDGKIVVAGSSNGFGLARYNANGSLDTGFGTGGEALSAFASGRAEVRALALQPDGQIVVAGWAALYCGGHSGCSPGLFALARYNANGSLDPSFGTGGTMLTDFGGGSAVARALAVQTDGQIIAVGVSNSPKGDQDFALARYRGR